MKQLYEQTLVVRSQIGDEAAFDELVRSYAPHLFRYVSKLMQAAPDLVEDLTQEIWLSIYKGLPNLRDPGKFRPWAFRIARDRVYREFRRHKIATEELKPDMSAEPAEGDPLIDKADLLRGLDSISREHREALVLCFLEDMSYEEISQVTGVSLGTVRSRIHYAKRALRSILTKEPI